MLPEACLGPDAGLQHAWVRRRPRWDLAWAGEGAITRLARQLEMHAGSFAAAANCWYRHFNRRQLQFEGSARFGGTGRLTPPCAGTRKRTKRLL